MNNKSFHGWKIVIGGLIVLAVFGPASVAVANLFQNPVVQAFGIDNSTFAISNTLVLGTGVLLSPVMSSKFAKGNFKMHFLIGALIYIVAYFLYGLAPNIWVFYILSIFVGYGFLTTTILPISIMITNWFFEKKGLALSIALSGLGIGGVIFSNLITYLLNAFGWRATYMIYAAIMLVVCVPIIWFIFDRAPEDRGQVALGVQKVEMPAHEDEVYEENTVPAKTKLVTSFFILLLIGSIIVGLSNNGGLGQFPPFLASIHGAERAALIVSIYSAVGIIGKLLLGNITDKFGIITSVSYTSILLATTYFIMLFSGSFTLMIIMAILFGLGNAIGTVLPPLITSAMYDSEDYGKVYGYVQGAVNLGMALGSLFVATIADVSGTYNVSWIAMVIICILIIVFWTTAYLISQKKSTKA